MSARGFVVGGGELVKRINQPRHCSRSHEPNICTYNRDELLCCADCCQLDRRKHPHRGARRTRGAGFGIQCKNRSLCRQEEITDSAPHPAKCGAQLRKRRSQNSDLRRRSEIRPRFVNQFADFRLHAADIHLQLLHLADGRTGELLIHLAHVVRDDLCQYSGALAFSAVLQHLFFGFAEGDTHAPQCIDLALQRFAEQVTHRHRVFLCGVDALLLCEEVVHRRHEGAERRSLRGECADLLRAGHLHRTTHHAELLLRRNYVFYALHVFGRGVHTLLHHGGELGVRHRRGFIALRIAGKDSL